MTGLWKKELYLQKRQLTSYAWILIVYSILTGAGVWGPYILTGMVVLVGLMCPLNAFALDQTCRWEAYVCTLPEGGRNAVRARYGVVVLMTLGSMAVVAADLMLMRALGVIQEEAGALLMGTLASGGICLLLTAVVLPLCYRFGIEKGRVLMIAVAAGAVGTLTAVGWLTARGMGKVCLPPLAVLLTAALLLLFWGSCRLSQRIFLAKER